MRLQHVLSLLLALCLINLSAQQETPSIPELLNSLKTLSAQDSLRAKTLLKLVDLTRRDDYEQSMSYNQQAIEAARIANHPTSLCLALRNGFSYARDNSDYKLASQYIAEGLKVAEINNLPIQKAWLTRSLGSLYMYMLDYERAVEYTMAAKDIAEAYKIAQLTSICYSDLGELFQMADNPREGIRYAQLAINRSRQGRTNHILLYNYITLARAYIDLGEIDVVPALLDSAKLLVAEGGYVEIDPWSVWMTEAQYLITTKREPQAAIQLLNSKLGGNGPESLDYWTFSYWELCTRAYGQLKDHKQTILYGQKAIDLAVNESKSDLSAVAKIPDFAFARMVADSYAELGLYADAHRVHQTIHALQDSLNKFQKLQVSNAHLVTLEIEGHDREWEEKNAALEAHNRKMRLIMVFLLPLLLGALVSSYLLYRWRKADKAAQTQKAINIDLETLVKARTAELEKASLATQAAKEREIASLALLNQQHGEFLEQLKQDIKNLQKSGEILKTPAVKTVVTAIDDAQKHIEEWGSFMMHFERLHPDFFQNLQAQASDLTPLDLRHCAYLRLGMSLKQVASILNCSTEAVRQARNRIRRKLGLSPESSLRLHLGAHVDAHAE